MQDVFFNNTLKLEMDLIGYRDKGESIVFFLKADNSVVYAGLVDCYQDDVGNEAIRLLEKADGKYFDFVCWTHPHEDHTVGMDSIIADYCESNTKFWMPYFVSKETCLFSQTVQETYSALFEVIELRRRNKMHVNSM